MNVSIDSLARTSSHNDLTINLCRYHDLSMCSLKYKILSSLGRIVAYYWFCLEKKDNAERWKCVGKERRKLLKVSCQKLANISSRFLAVSNLSCYTSLLYRTHLTRLRQGDRQWLPVSVRELKGSLSSLTVCYYF